MFSHRIQRFPQDKLSKTHTVCGTLAGVGFGIWMVAIQIAPQDRRLSDGLVVGTAGLTTVSILTGILGGVGGFAVGAMGPIPHLLGTILVWHHYREKR